MMGNPGEVWMLRVDGAGSLLVEGESFFLSRFFSLLLGFLTSALWSDSEWGIDDKPPLWFCPTGDSQPAKEFGNEGGETRCILLIFPS